jgi:hypothetical protein
MYVDFVAMSNYDGHHVRHDRVHLYHDDHVHHVHDDHCYCHDHQQNNVMNDANHVLRAILYIIIHE